MHAGQLVVECSSFVVPLQDTGDLNACFNAIRELVPKNVGNAISVVVLRPPLRSLGLRHGSVTLCTPGTFVL